MNPRNNAVCYANIDRDGVYICGGTLEGAFVGLTRDSGQYDWFNIAELRAYPWVPFDETNSIITCSSMPNGTLDNSVHLLSDPNGGLISNSFFTTGPTVNCWWMM